MTNPNTSSKTQSQNPRKRKATTFAEDVSVREGQREDNPERATDPLEGPSQSFGVRSTYHQYGVFVSLEELEKLGYDLKDFLEPYMGWLSIKNDFNDEVLSSFFSSLKSKAQRCRVTNKILKVDFTATVRGRKMSFDFKKINNILGINPGSEHYKWKIHDDYPSEEEKAIYDSNNGKPSGMPAINRLLHFIYTRIMVHKPGNFGEFAVSDNPWLPRFLEKKDICPGQLISLELHRYNDEKKNKPKAKLPYPQFISYLIESFNIQSTERKNKGCKVLGSTHLKQMRKMPYLGKGTASESAGGSQSQTHLPSTSAAAEVEVQSRAPRGEMPLGMIDELVSRMTGVMNRIIEEKVELKLDSLDDRVQRLESTVSQLSNNLCPQAQGNLSHSLSSHPTFPSHHYTHSPQNFSIIPSPEHYQNFSSPQYYQDIPPPPNTHTYFPSSSSENPESPDHQVPSNTHIYFSSSDSHSSSSSQPHSPPNSPPQNQLITFASPTSPTFSDQYSDLALTLIEPLTISIPSQPTDSSPILPLSLDLSPVPINFDDDKRGRNMEEALLYRLAFAAERVRQPSLWVDSDMAEVLRRANERRIAQLVEQRIREEAIRYMEQQSAASSVFEVTEPSSPPAEQELQMVVYKNLEPVNTLRPDGAEFLNHLRRKYNHLPQTTDTSQSAGASNPVFPPNSSPGLASSKSHMPRGRKFKATARKNVPRIPVVRREAEIKTEPESVSVSTSEHSESSSVWSKLPVIPDPPVIKIEIEDMTSEEMECFGGTNVLTQEDAFVLDALRTKKRLASENEENEDKRKRKKNLTPDPSYDPWSFNTKKVHLPPGVPLGGLASLFKPEKLLQNNVPEEDALKIALELSSKEEQERKAREEREVQKALKLIDDFEMEEMWERVTEEYLKDQRGKP